MFQTFLCLICASWWPVFLNLLIELDTGGRSQARRRLVDLICSPTVLAWSELPSANGFLLQDKQPCPQDGPHSSIVPCPPLPTSPTPPSLRTASVTVLQVDRPHRSMEVCWIRLPMCLPRRRPLFSNPSPSLCIHLSYSTQTPFLSTACSDCREGQVWWLWLKKKFFLNFSYLLLIPINSTIQFTSPLYCICITNIFIFQIIDYLMYLLIYLQKQITYCFTCISFFYWNIYLILLDSNNCIKNSGIIYYWKPLCSSVLTSVCTCKRPFCLLGSFLQYAK